MTWVSLAISCSSCSSKWSNVEEEEWGDYKPGPSWSVKRWAEDFKADETESQTKVLMYYLEWLLGTKLKFFHYKVLTKIMYL